MLPLFRQTAFNLILNKLLFILLLFSCSLCAQDTMTFGLWKKANDKNEKDTTRILALVEFAYKINIKMPDSSYQLAKKALAMSTAINYPKGKGRAQRMIATYFRSKGEIPEALHACDSAIRFAQLVGDLKGLASAQLLTGLIYQEQGKFQQALEIDFLALKGFQKLGEVRNVAVLYENIGLVHYDQKNYHKAIEYLINASQMSAKVDDKSLSGLIFANLGYVYQTQKDFKNALVYQYKSLEILEEAGDFRTATYPYNSLAEIYIIKQDFPRALQYLQRGLEIAEKGNYQDRISDLSKTYGQYFNETHDYKKAMEYANRAEALGQKVQNVELVRNASEQKYLAAYKLGNFREALMSYQLFRTMKDSMQDEANRRNSLALEFAFREEKLKLENDALTVESQLRESQLQLTLYFLAVIVLLALVIGYLAYTYYRSFRKNAKLKDQIQEKNEELQAKQEEISAQNEELMQSHEEISAHRDLVEEQNIELERAKIVIEKQNQDIKLRNANLNEEVEKRTRELLEYNQQLEQFAFVSSHNLRAPVARILGLGNLLQLSGKSASDETLITKSLIHSTHELDRVVRDLNTILEIRQGAPSVVTKINLSEELQMVLINLEKEIADTNAMISSDFSQAPIIHTVRPYLDSILLNLIGNSIKYRHPNRTPLIHLKTEPRGNLTCLIASDNGLGIDLATYGEKLFKLYSRFHLHVEGKGLGLHLVKTQVTAMGGKIEVESKVNEGITFSIYFKEHEI